MTEKFPDMMQAMSEEFMMSRPTSLGTNYMSGGKYADFENARVIG